MQDDEQWGWCRWDFELQREMQKLLGEDAAPKMKRAASFKKDLQKKAGSLVKEVRSIKIV